MYVLARALLLVAVTSSAVVGASTQSTTPQSKEANATGMIAGRVTIAGKPAANIAVGLVPDSQLPGINNRERFAVSGMTDADGRFQLAHVPAGRYRVKTAAPAFYNETDGNGYGSGKPIMLAEGETVDDIAIALRRGGVITGHLTDAAGRPLIQEHVFLSQVGPRGDKRGYTPSSFNMLQTDDRGVYRVYGLPAGRYLVSAGTPIHEGATRIGFGNSYYAQTFYPGVSDEAKANAVEVTEGGEATGIDIVLGRAEKAYTVILRLVAAESGKPVAGVRCGYGVLDADGKSLNGSSIGSESNAKGECRLEGVLPGKYLAMLAFSNDVGQNYTYEPAPFEVTEGDINNVEIKLQQGASISGTVIIEGMSEQEAATHFRELMLGVFSPALLTTPRLVRPQINADGSFRLDSLPAGKAQMMVWSYPRHNVTLLRVERNGADQSEGFDLAPGESVTGVRLIVGIGSCVIRGEVKIADGPLPEGISLWVTARRLGDSGPHNHYQAETDVRGRFVLDGLMPGDYEINTSLHINRPDVVPVRLKPFAKTVTVTSEQETQITIPLERLADHNQ